MPLRGIHKNKKGPSMMKNIGDNYIHFLAGLLVMLPASAFPESSIDESIRVPPKALAAPPINLDLSSWMDEVHAESMARFREEWQAEAKQVFGKLGRYEARLAMEPAARTRLVEEAQETLAGILAQQEDSLAITPATESLAAN